MGRVGDIAKGSLAVGSAVVGYALAGLFILAMLGGGVYRTDCVVEGRHSESWGLGGDIPYLWSSGDPRCEDHTLTRYVLGKVGLMKELS